MKREYRDYVQDILDSMEKIEKFTLDMGFHKFEEDDKTVLAVVKTLEIIGEAVKKIPVSMKRKHPDIPWKQMAGMRDKLVHEYFGIDNKVVWKTIRHDIPPLKPLIRDFLKDIDRQKELFTKQ